MSTLPAWLEALPDAQTMREVDRWAIEDRGVASLELMERAGGGVVRALERLAPDGPVTVVCGKGNNGGDGLVVARLLRESGRPVTVVCAAAPAELLRRRPREPRASAGRAARAAERSTLDSRCPGCDRGAPRRG